MVLGAISKWVETRCLHRAFRTKVGNRGATTRRVEFESLESRLLLSDTVAPTVITRSPLPNSVISLSGPYIDVTFSEPVRSTGLGSPDASDLSFSGSPAAGVRVTSVQQISETKWRFWLAGVHLDGTLKVKLAPDAGDIKDIIGNNLAPTSWNYSVQMDRIAAINLGIPNSTTVPSGGAIPLSWTISKMSGYNFLLSGSLIPGGGGEQIPLTGTQSIVSIGDVCTGFSTFGMPLGTPAGPYSLLLNLWVDVDRDGLLGADDSLVDSLVTSQMYVTAAPTIVIQNPNGGEYFRAEGALTINWKLQGDTSLVAHQLLQLVDGNRTIPFGYLLAGSLRTYSSFLDSTLVGTNWKLKIVLYDAAFHVISVAESERTFTIADPTQVPIDLQVPDPVTTTPNPAIPGGSVLFNYVLQNFSDFVVDAGAIARVQIKNGTGAIFVDQDFPIGRIERYSLITHTHALTLPSSMPSGNYIIAVTLDRYGVVLQSNESNDFGYGSLTVVSQTSPPNLVPQNVALSKYSGQAGDNLTVNWSMSNSGLGVAGATITGLRLGTSASSPLGTDMVAGYPTPKIGSNSSLNQSAIVTIPKGTSPGTYYVWVVADNSVPSDLDQTNTSDDFAHSAAITVLPPPAAPPLVPSEPIPGSATILLAEPSSVTLNSGSSFTVTYSIVAPAPLNVLLGSSLRMVNSDKSVNLVTQNQTVNLAAGPNNFSRTYTVPPGTLIGPYDLLTRLWKDGNNNGDIDSPPDTTIGSLHITTNAVNIQAATVGPLFNFPTWNQNGAVDDTRTVDWNKYVPVDPISFSPSVTGCTATAIAQVFYYWGVRGLGPTSISFTAHDSYTSRGDDGDINIFGDATKYGFMPMSVLNDRLSTIYFNEDPNEKALLSFAVGLKAKMNYASVPPSRKGSGAYVTNEVFHDLGFQSASMSYDWASTKPIAITNIGAHKPVVLAVSGSNGGHAIVLEGYNPTTDEFYINMGWGGEHDGWYSLPNLVTPGGSFNTINTVVYNISPELEAPATISATQGSYEDGIRVSWNASPAAIGYSVWRNTIDNPKSAEKVTSSLVLDLGFNDVTANVGQMYYYWVQSVSPIGESDLGSSTSGGTHVDSLGGMAPQSGIARSFFNENYYLENNSDVANAVKNNHLVSGWTHFLAYGQSEGRSPSALYDDAYYLARNADVAYYVAQNSNGAPRTGSNAISNGFAHFVQYGYMEGRNGSSTPDAWAEAYVSTLTPSPRDMHSFFDASYYTARYPDVRKAIGLGQLDSAWDHFVSFGQFEGRNPSTQFDNEAYVSNNSDVVAAISNHSFESGIRHFSDFGFWEGRLSGGRTQNCRSPLTPRTGDVSAFFDEEYYLKNNADVRAAVYQGVLLSGWTHFMSFGLIERRRPSTNYDEFSYLASNPDVASSVTSGIFVNGFTHYVLYGYAENRNGF